MEARQFIKMKRFEKLAYIKAVRQTAEYLRWVGEDMHEAADEVDSLYRWFKHLSTLKDEETNVPADFIY